MHKEERGHSVHKNVLEFYLTFVPYCTVFRISHYHFLGLQTWCIIHSSRVQWFCRALSTLQQGCTRQCHIHNFSRKLTDLLSFKIVSYTEIIRTFCSKPNKRVWRVIMLLYNGYKVLYVKGSRGSIQLCILAQMYSLLQNQGYKPAKQLRFPQ